MEKNEDNSQIYESFMLFQKFMDSFMKVSRNKPEVYGSNTSNSPNNPNNNNNNTISISNTNSISFPIGKNFVSYDERPIRHTSVNFVELVEKNLKELGEDKLPPSASCPKLKDTSIDMKNFSFEKCETTKKLQQTSTKKKDNNKKTKPNSSNVQQKSVPNKSLNQLKKRMSLKTRNQNEKRTETGPLTLTKPNVTSKKDKSFNSSKSGDIIYNFSSLEESHLNDPSKTELSINIPKGSMDDSTFIHEMNLVREKVNEVNSKIESYSALSKSHDKRRRNASHDEFKKFMLEKKNLEEERQKFKKEVEAFVKWKDEEEKKIKKEKLVIQNEKKLFRRRKEGKSKETHDFLEKEENYKKIIKNLQFKLIEANEKIVHLQKTPHKAQVNSVTKTSKKVLRSGSLPDKVKSVKVNRPVLNSILSAKKQNASSQKSIPKVEAQEIPKRYGMIFPVKYNLEPSTIVSKEVTNEGKVIINYSNAQEVTTPTGTKEVKFEDGYIITYYKNKDIKQYFPNGKIVYFFDNTKITKTYLPEINVTVYRYKNGDVEKHYANGKKEFIHTELPK